MVMASAGQTSTQEPQSTQSSSDTTALSSTISIAAAGHSSTHVSQPVQVSLLINTVIKSPIKFIRLLKISFETVTFLKKECLWFTTRELLSFHTLRVSSQQSTALPESLLLQKRPDHKHDEKE